MKTESTALFRSIAQHLDASVATVSRALNNDSPFHPETIAKVLKKAVDELGYAAS